MEKTIAIVALVVSLAAAACSADDDGSSAAAAAGAGTGGEQLGGLGGAGAGGELGTGGAGELAGAPPTVFCPVDLVAGTACSKNGYVYLPGDPSAWCSECYEWTPPAVHPPVNYQTGCLAHPASIPSLTVQCVTSCDACEPCPPGVACVKP